MTQSTDFDLLIVTGAASGIGHAMVRAGMARGAQVLALDVQNAEQDLLQQTTDSPGELIFMRCDVSNPDDWQAVAEQVKKLGVPGQIHLNAGIQIAPPEAPLTDYEFEAMALDRYRLMICLLYTSPSPRDKRQSRMPSSA